MPGPESCTATRAPAWSCSLLINSSLGPSSTEPIASAALRTRFNKTCCSWTRSPRTGCNPSASRVWTETPFLAVTLCANTITSLIAAFEIKALLSRRRFLDLLSDAIDDVSGSICVRNHTRECFPDLAQIRRLHFQKILGCPGVVARAGDRLRDFVRERGCQFSHHAHSVHVGEIRFHLLQPRQRLRAILDVRIGAVPRNDPSCVVARRLPTKQEPAIRSIIAAHAGFNFARLFRCKQLQPDIIHARKVFGMDRPSPLPT